MLQPATFARYRYNLFRVHYQWVMANDKPAPYDYFLMVCGPIAFGHWTTSRDGFLNLIAADGTLRDASRGIAAVAEQAS